MQEEQKGTEGILGERACGLNGEGGKGCVCEREITYTVVTFQSKLQSLGYSSYTESPIDQGR